MEVAKTCRKLITKAKVNAQRVAISSLVAMDSLSDQRRFRPAAGPDPLNRFRVFGSAEHT